MKMFSRSALPAGAKMSDWDVWLATLFGAGLWRPASGTIGTLAAVPFAVFVSWALGPAGVLLAAIVLVAAGVAAANRFSARSGNKDDPSIVIDEAAGLMIAAIPAKTNLILWVLAFLLFRLFDIWKPWPVSYFDRRKHGGFDVVMDDVVAGLYALCGVSVVALFLLARGAL